MILMLPGCRSLVEMRVSTSDLAQVNNNEHTNTTIFKEECNGLKCNRVEVAKISVPVLDNLTDLDKVDFALINTKNRSVLLFIHPRFLETIKTEYGIDIGDVDVKVVVLFTNNTNRNVNLFLRGVWINDMPIGNGGVIVEIEPGQTVALRLSALSSDVLKNEYVEGVFSWSVKEK
ncbi:hypothetical protein [Vibrio phage VP-1]|nr:hypothetical protein [Vibrio phage VP-1]